MNDHTCVSKSYKYTSPRNDPHASLLLSDDAPNVQHLTPVYIYDFGTCRDKTYFCFKELG